MDTARVSWNKRLESRRPSQIRFYDIDVEPDRLISDIRPMLMDIRPHWDLENLAMHNFSCGAINHMTRVYQKGGQREDSIVVRVHGMNFVDGYDHRSEEILAFQFAKAADCFPATLAVFLNGVIYQFMPGEKMNHIQFSDPDIISQIVCKLYSLHHTEMDVVNFVQRGAEGDHEGVSVRYEPTRASPGDSFINLIRLFESTSPTQSMDNTLLAECEYLRNYLNDLPLPMCFSHTDLHPGNIVYNDRTNEISLIDYETAGVHIEYSDLARLFSYDPFDDRERKNDADYESPAEVVKCEYIICYRDAAYEYHGYDPAAVPEDQRQHDLELLTVGHKIMERCMYFFRTAQLRTLGSALDRDDMLQRSSRFEELYKSNKDQLPMLAQWYKRLASTQ